MLFRSYVINNTEGFMSVNQTTDKLNKVKCYFQVISNSNFCVTQRTD